MATSYLMLIKEHIYYCAIIFQSRFDSCNLLVVVLCNPLCFVHLKVFFSGLVSGSSGRAQVVNHEAQYWQSGSANPRTGKKKGIFLKRGP